ncbi:MAG: hypothetical protein RLZZ180_505, partial [Pseudomonadota bacterium]
MTTFGHFQLLLGSQGGRLSALQRGAIAAVAIAILWWAALGSQISFVDLAQGAPWMADFISRMFPPNLEFAAKLVKPAIETIQIAIWGTLFAIVMAVPVCFLAARNISPNI